VKEEVSRQRDEPAPTAVFRGWDMAAGGGFAIGANAHNFLRRFCPTSNAAHLGDVQALFQNLLRAEINAVLLMLGDV